MKSRLKYLSIATFILTLGLWLHLQYYFNPTDYSPAPLAKPNLAIKENAAKEDAAIVSKEEAVGIKPFNVILLGIDARDQENSRTDLIMLSNVNPKEKTVQVVSIPRDTWVELPGVGHTKINHAHLLGEIKGGAEEGTWASLQAVSELLQCEIDYYIKLDFDVFSDFIDTIGGIEIDLEKPVTLTFDKKILPAGKQHLDGYMALKLVRERFSLPDGDFGRQKLQFLVLETLASKLLEPRSLPKLPALLEEIRNRVETNLNIGDVIALARTFQKLPKENITHIQLPGRGGYAADRLVKGSLYFWFPDSEQIQEISERFRNP
jgi:LCP family protein required for cell wall assembly